MPTIRWSLLAFAFSCIPCTISITCYECTSNEGQDCKFTAKSCAYGFFGCVKIATFTGGVDRMGNWEVDQERRINSMMRGCALIPFGSVDMCTQSSLLGVRIQRCTCFNDYCNSSSTFSFLLTLFITILIY